MNHLRESRVQIDLRQHPPKSRPHSHPPVTPVDDHNQGISTKRGHTAFPMIVDRRLSSQKPAARSSHCPAVGFTPFEFFARKKKGKRRNLVDIPHNGDMLFHLGRRAANPAGEAPQVWAPYLDFVNSETLFTLAPICPRGEFVPRVGGCVSGTRKRVRASRYEGPGCSRFWYYSAPLLSPLSTLLASNLPP